MSTIIEMKNISLQYRLRGGNQLSVLDNFNLKIKDGEIIALLGASGVGKTSCARILSGLQKASEGKVFLEGKELHSVSSEIGVVFQDIALLPWLTVAENIEFGLYPKGFNLRIRRQRVTKAIDFVGLEGFEEAYPRELSGGMKQRVGIARALAAAPKILCMDEPFSALDAMTAETLRGEVLDIWQKKETNLKSILLITHDIAEAVSLANRIIIIGSTPNSIKAEFENHLIYPRDENSWQFSHLVRRIHSVITETILSDKPAQSYAEEQSLWIIPPVPITDVIGITELLIDHNEILDIFELPELTEKDLSDALLAVKAAELMGFVDTPHHKIILTPMGRNVGNGDVNERKELIRQQLLSLKLVKLLINKLENEPDSELSTEDVLEWLHSISPALNPQDSMDTLIAWGRYGEIFRFNSDSATISLDDDIPTI